MPGTREPSRRRVLLTPKWLSWHAFVVVSVLAMLWLGRWQLHRAESGNPLSWAYTFEWPLFAIFAVVFWVKTVKDELAPPPPAATPDPVTPDTYLDQLTREVSGHGRWHGLR